MGTAGKIIRRRANAHKRTRGNKTRAPRQAVTLTVGTDIQAEAVRKFEPQIRAMLCDSLSNDKISTAIEVCQGDIPPAFWTEQQVLEHLTAQNPAVAEMISKYKMRLT